MCSKLVPVIFIGWNIVVLTWKLFLRYVLENLEGNLECVSLAFLSFRPGRWFPQVIVSNSWPYWLWHKPANLAAFLHYRLIYHAVEKTRVLCFNIVHQLLVTEFNTSVKHHVHEYWTLATCPLKIAKHKSKEQYSSGTQFEKANLSSPLQFFHESFRKPHRKYSNFFAPNAFHWVDVSRFLYFCSWCLSGKTSFCIQSTPRHS